MEGFGQDGQEEVEEGDRPLSSLWLCWPVRREEGQNVSGEANEREGSK